jgi:hypothetical protein
LSDIVTGIFGNPEDAQKAKDALVRNGVAPQRITISGTLTGDDIAAEAPGQSYDNQPGQPESETAWSRYAEAIRTGTCIVSVAAVAVDEQPRIETLLRRSGARGTVQQPP